MAPRLAGSARYPAARQPHPQVAGRTFGWLIRNRRLSRDYERRTGNSEAMIKIAMIRLMAIRLAGKQVRWSNRVM